MLINDTLPKPSLHFVDGVNTDEQAGDVFGKKPVLWSKSNPRAQIDIWYDGLTTHKEAIGHTQEYLNALTKKEGCHPIRLRDVRSLPEVGAHKEAFSSNLPVYFRADVLRNVVLANEVAAGVPTAIYADLKVAPLTQEMLFDHETTGHLKETGIVMWSGATASNPKLGNEFGLIMLSGQNHAMKLAFHEVAVMANIKTAENFIHHPESFAFDVEKFKRYRDQGRVRDSDDLNTKRRILMSETAYARFTDLKVVAGIRKGEIKLYVKDPDGKPKPYDEIEDGPLPLSYHQYGSAGVPSPGLMDYRSEHFKSPSDRHRYLQIPIKDLARTISKTSTLVPVSFEAKPVEDDSHEADARAELLRKSRQLLETHHRSKDESVHKLLLRGTPALGSDTELNAKSTVGTLQGHASEKEKNALTHEQIALELKAAGLGEPAQKHIEVAQQLTYQARQLKNVMQEIQEKVQFLQENLHGDPHRRTKINEKPSQDRHEDPMRIPREAKAVGHRIGPDDSPTSPHPEHSKSKDQETAHAHTTTVHRPKEANPHDATKETESYQRKTQGLHNAIETPRGKLEDQRSH